MHCLENQVLKGGLYFLFWERAKAFIIKRRKVTFPADRCGVKAISNFSNWAVRFNIFTVKPPLEVIITKAESSLPKRPNFMAEITSLPLYEKKVPFIKKLEALRNWISLYEKQSTTCLSLKIRTCLFSRATAANWTPRDGISNGSRHLTFAGNFWDQILFPLEL